MSLKEANLSFKSPSSKPLSNQTGSVFALSNLIGISDFNFLIVARIRLQTEFYPVQNWSLEMP